jgi:2-methylisocitrate lyase-like PEP mutase family enzyme
MEERLVTIATFTDYIEAELAKQLLADFGIKSILTGQNVASVYAGVLGLRDLELQTFENQAQRAWEILESKGQQEQ